MLTSQRKQLILDLLKQNGQVVAKHLSQQWNLSEDTIRRDLRDLARDGLVLRVHGGALPASPAVANLAVRSGISIEQKAALGRAGAALVQRGQVVAIDGGTTSVQLVRHLPRDLPFTVVTHSPSIAVELMDHPSIEVLLIGGRLFRHSMVSVGSAAIEAIERIRVDIFFMGATGIHPKTGATTGDFEEAAVKRALSRQSAETIVLASPEKLNAASPYLIVPIGELSGLVVESWVSEEVLAPFREQGLSIYRA